MRNIKCSDCAEYRNEWCEKVIDSPHPDILRDCQYFHDKDRDVIKVIRCKDCKFYTSMRSDLKTGICALLQPEKKSVLIIKANVLMKKEQLEQYRQIFAQQKKDGVVLLPNTFEAEYIPDDVEIRIEGQDERKEIQEGPADQDDI